MAGFHKIQENNMRKKLSKTTWAVLMLSAGMLMSTPSVAQAGDLAVQVKAAGSVSDVITKLKGMIHKNGMMVMGELHQGKVMSMVGLSIESESIFVGNATVGKKLFSANSGAGIAVPVRINVYKAANGSTMVTYVPPSRVLAVYHNPMMSKVAGMLDGKLKKMTGMLGGM